VHAAAAEPLLVDTAGSASAGERADASMRNPWEPVSTWMLSMVWQVAVPGTQMVTLVCNMLRVLVAIRATVIGWTLGVVDWATAVFVGAAGVCAVVAGELVAGAAAEAEVAGAAAVAVELSPPPPPPQPPNVTQANTRIANGKDVGFRMACSYSMSAEVTPAGNAPGSQARPVNSRNRTLDCTIRSLPSTLDECSPPALDCASVAPC
jgi:hypothetical protein